MLNERKIKKMRKMASFEAGEGKSDLAITNYYRSDYIGLGLIKNFFLITFAYVLMVGMYLGYKSEYLMENLHKMNLITFGATFIVLYVAMLFLYSVVTYIYCSVKYSKAQDGIQHYYKDLNQLKKLYDREEKKAGRETGRRKNV